MRRLVVSAVGVLSAVLAYTPAFSAELPIKPRPSATRPAPAPQASNWSGGQIGGNGGGSIGNNNFIEPGSIVCPAGVPCSETDFRFDDNASSFVGGIFLGYRWQMGNTVFGVEGDATWQELESSLTQNSVTLIGAVPRTDDFSGSITQGWEGSLRLRYGWLINPAMLLYVTGGVSFLEAKGSFAYNGSIPANPTTVSGSGSWSDTLVGWTAGVGVESDISSLFGIPGVKARAEYRYTNYGSYSKDVALGCSGVCNAITAPSSNAHIEVDNVDNHKFLLGLGFELGG